VRIGSEYDYGYMVNIHDCVRLDGIYFGNTVIPNIYDIKYAINVNIDGEYTVPDVIADSISFSFIFIEADYLLDCDVTAKVKYNTNKSGDVVGIAPNSNGVAKDCNVDIKVVCEAVVGCYSYSGGGVYIDMTAIGIHRYNTTAAVENCKTNVSATYTYTLPQACKFYFTARTTEVGISYIEKGLCKRLAFRCRIY
jgi:hypothetical protein